VTLFINIHIDDIDSGAGQTERLEEQIRQRMARFEDRITDVEVYVSDVNGPKGGGSDLKSTMEVRLNGVQPIAVVDNGPSVDRAVINAAKKAVRALDHQLGKLNDARRGS
jgi:hypothetical protein